MSDDKAKGAKKVCSKCQTKLICNEIIKEYQGKKETKLQWQNELDGKPHYYYKGPGKYECSPPKETDVAKPAETKPAAAPEQPTPDKILGQFVIEETVTIQQIETLVKKALPDGSNDAKIGMYVKEIYRQQKIAVRENLPWILIQI